jgi:hypothetical protein
MTNEQSDAWLAGLLEGEGYFGMVTNHVGGHFYRYPRVGVSMTDADIVDRVADLWDTSVYEAKPAGVSKKVQYRCVLLGTRAVNWMERLYPFLGERRSCRTAPRIEHRGSASTPRRRR